MQDLNDSQLLDHLNKQTAKINWLELERAFAQGLVLQVSPQLDLIDVAFHFIRDNASDIKTCIDNQQLLMISTEQAREWSEQSNDFWAVVVSP